MSFPMEIVSFIFVSNHRPAIPPCSTMCNMREMETSCLQHEGSFPSNIDDPRRSSSLYVRLQSLTKCQITSHTSNVDYDSVVVTILISNGNYLVNKQFKKQGCNMGEAKMCDSPMFYYVKHEGSPHGAFSVFSLPEVADTLLFLFTKLALPHVTG